MEGLAYLKLLVQNQQFFYSPRHVICKKPLIPDSDRSNVSLKMGYKLGKMSFLSLSLLEHCFRDEMVSTSDRQKKMKMSAGE